MTDNKSQNSHSDADFQISVNPALGQKILDAFEFPLQIDFPEGSFSEADVEPYVEPAEVPAAAREGEGLDEVMQEVVAQPLAESYREGIDIDALTGSGESWQSVDEDCPPRAEARAETIDKSRTKVQLLSLSLVVPSAPSICLGNPTGLSDITVRVHAKVNACVKVFGKWRCMAATIPWVTISGGRAKLELTACDAAVFAIPVVENMDLLASIKIFKWQIHYKLGITNIVNRELKKRGPVQILDLTSLEQSVPFMSKKPRVGAIAFSESADGLVVKAGVSFT